MTKITKAALFAIRELEKNDVVLPIDEKAWAEDYAAQGYKALAAYPSGYDPDKDATDMAFSAVVEYVKAKLVGANPDSAQQYILALRAWFRAAAIEYYQ